MDQADQADQADQMDLQPTNIVWLKRDFRLQDHAPLRAAEEDIIPYYIVYFLEPSLIHSPDTSLRHLQFAYGSIMEMNRQLESKLESKKNVERSLDVIHVFHGDAIDILSYIFSKRKVQNIFSHQETGCLRTWDRDKQIQELCKHKGVRWQEFPTNGIVRGPLAMQDWRKKWHNIMQQPVVQNQFHKAIPFPNNHPFSLSESIQQKLSEYPKAFQTPGEKHAWSLLRTFGETRIQNYSKYISKPGPSHSSCSRLSPYISFGNLSIRQVYQHLRVRPKYPQYKWPFQAALDRLRWHCHFIQKMEINCKYETECVNPGYEKLVFTNNDTLLEAWKTGNTGVPLVDACMRCLHTTGWINFRMRAMLVSFLCHYLDQDWRRGVYHLAKLFLDYEPGIHYPQFQMQAGITGINTIRIYNPHKQFLDHDPQGKFTQHWVRELQGFPIEYLPKPHGLSEMEKQWFSQEHLQYPRPVVDLDKAYKQAKDKLWGHRKDKDVQYWKKQIIDKYLRASKKRPSINQEDLFEMG